MGVCGRNQKPVAKKGFAIVLYPNLLPEDKLREAMEAFSFRQRASRMISTTCLHSTRIHCRGAVELCRAEGSVVCNGGFDTPETEGPVFARRRARVKLRHQKHRQGRQSDDHLGDERGSYIARVSIDIHFPVSRETNLQISHWPSDCGMDVPERELVEQSQFEVFRRSLRHCPTAKVLVQTFRSRCRW